MCRRAVLVVYSVLQMPRRCIKILTLVGVFNIILSLQKMIPSLPWISAYSKISNTQEQAWTRPGSNQCASLEKVGISRSEISHMPLEAIYPTHKHATRFFPNEPYGRTDSVACSRESIITEKEEKWPKPHTKSKSLLALRPGMERVS